MQPFSILFAEVPVAGVQQLLLHNFGFVLEKVVEITAKAADFRELAVAC